MIVFLLDVLPRYLPLSVTASFPIGARVSRSQDGGSVVGVVQCLYLAGKHFLVFLAFSFRRVCGQFSPYLAHRTSLSDCFLWPRRGRFCLVLSLQCIYERFGS